MKSSQGRVMSGPYLQFFEYLENRYAGTVVLTFAQIESLLGSALPAAALVMTNGGPAPRWMSDSPSAPIAGSSPAGVPRQI